MVELADTPDLGSGAVRFGGSSPPSRILDVIIAADNLRPSRKLYLFRGTDVLYEFAWEISEPPSRAVAL